MIQHSFTGAYTNRVSQQNQFASNVWRGAKDVATVATGVAGFTGALGEGIVAQAAEYNLASRIGGIGGAIMLSSLKEKEDAAKAREEQKQVLSAEDIQAQLGDNPINRPALKQLNTVFETLTKAKEQGLVNKKGKLETSMGDIDPNSELGKKIMGGIK